MKTELTEQDYELLSQYLDGELPAAQAQQLRERLLAEPSLRAGFERIKTVNDHLTGAFGVSGVDAVPAHVVQMLQHPKSHEDKGFYQRRVGWGLAVAASVLAAAGLLLNPGQNDQRGDELAQTGRHDALLSPVLEQSLSRGDGWIFLVDGTSIRPLLSFPSVEGGWCREYLLTDAGSEWRGVACRSAGQWVTAVLAAVESSGTIDQYYRPAGATTPDQVTAFIDSKSANIPLSQEQETELIARGWQ
jgi:hypothetical protein